ncbi:MAG: ATP-binding protein [Bacteroidales bacterium]|nr:ATP-binding protein [Bacteroidales bacterium]
MKNKRNLYFIIILIVLYIANGVLFFYNKTDNKNINKRFEKQINETFNDITTLGNKFVFSGDSLIYWQTNTIPVDSSVLKNKRNIIELKNGHYLQKMIQNNDTTTVFLYLIKNNYSITNKYLDNSFNEPFTLNKNINISFVKTNYPIKIANNVVCYLDTSHYSLNLSQTDFFIFHLSILITIFFTIVFFISLIKKNKLRPIVSIFLLILIYVLYCSLIICLCTKFQNIIFCTNKYNILFFIIISLSGFLVYLLTIKISNINKENRYFLSKKLLIILCISILCGTIIECFAYKSLQQRVENKANTLSKQRNILLEQRFSKLSLRFNSDKQLKQIIKTNYSQKIEKYITNKYFPKLKDTYHIGVLVFNDNEIMVVQPNNYVTNTLDYVANRLKNVSRFCKDTCCFVENSEIDDSKTYMYFSKLDNKNIFIECLKKKESKNMNYSLLLGNDSDDNFDNLSYAKYYKNNLVYSYGERNFDLTKSKQIKGWFKEKTYNNYYVNNDKEKTIWVVSYKNEFIYNLLNIISLFFFTLTVMISIEYIINIIPHLSTLSLTIRSSILLSLIGAFIISSLILGFFGISSIRSLNKKNNIDILKEKTQSVQIELEKNLYNNNKLKLSNSSLTSLSNSFLTDINLFDTNGVLISSSQKTIFEKGYLLNMIDNKALNKLKKGNTTMFYQQEKIGNRIFLASYCPIMNEKGITVAYLNIPFINQQKTMEDNINNMVNNFINIFLFWISISVIIFIFLSNIITKPLSMLKDKLNRLNIDKKNEKIVWNRQDEIGELIIAYNLMVDKIEESSYLLKQNERESSWRELAKQVAHDIKNPLTPMKLSIQYLQKLYDEDKTLFSEKFKEISPSLINQIDTISNIASELSDYSKNKNITNEKVDIDACIKDAINLFNNQENITIEYTTPIFAPIYVNGDKQLFIRLMNNLIKNSSQALYKNKDDGKIVISIDKNEDKYTINIKDNGCGIKQEDRDKIFNTHFSTKSEGNGIGLSIVKSILDNYNGQISFSSKENEGTIFFITLNAFKEK